MSEFRETTIVIEKPKRTGVPEKIEIKVPFGQEEVDSIKNAWEAKESLMPFAMASGLSREVAATYGVPWGYALMDRDRALARMAETVGYIDKNLTPRYEAFLKPEEAVLIKQIQTNLMSLLKEKSD